MVKQFLFKKIHILRQNIHFLKIFIFICCFWDLLLGLYPYFLIIFISASSHKQTAFLVTSSPHLWGAGRGPGVWEMLFVLAGTGVLLLGLLCVQGLRP